MQYISQYAKIKSEIPVTGNINIFTNLSNLKINFTKNLKRKNTKNLTSYFHLEQIYRIYKTSRCPTQTQT